MKKTVQLCIFLSLFSIAILPSDNRKFDGPGSEMSRLEIMSRNESCAEKVRNNCVVGCLLCACCLDDCCCCKQKPKVKFESFVGGFCVAPLLLLIGLNGLLSKKKQNDF